MDDLTIHVDRPYLTGVSAGQFILEPSRPGEPRLRIVFGNDEAMRDWAQTSVDCLVDFFDQQAKRHQEEQIA